MYNQEIYVPVANSMDKWTRTGSGGSRNTKAGSLRIFNGWWVGRLGVGKSQSASQTLSGGRILGGWNKNNDDGLPVNS